MEFDNIDLIKIDADDDSNAKYLEYYDIRSIPTLILEDADGRIIDTLVGETSAENLTLWIEDNLGILY